MHRHENTHGRANDRRALLVVGLGLLVAVAPFLLVPAPGDGGPITFVVRLAQVVAVLVGLGVAGTGYRAYRTGDLRPAAAIGLSVVALTLVGAVGGLFETSGGPLISIPAWLLAGIVAVGLSVWAAYRFVGAD